MLFYIFYSNIFIMGFLTFSFHYILKIINIEKEMYGKFSINMMRSLICGTIAHEAYKNYKYIWLDKCLDNEIILNKFKEYHYMFLSYFIFDTILLVYQVYLKIEKNIRLDLLLHHILAISALIIIENYGLFNISLMIGISEGMSLVTGPKLLSMHIGNKFLTNIFIVYRLLYLIFIRMLFLWPSLIYFYNYVTLNCDKYKNDRNIFLVIFFIMIIIHAEINWLHSGRKELSRI
jgi:hypothetical protein